MSSPMTPSAPPLSNPTHQVQTERMREGIYWGQRRHRGRRRVSPNSQRSCRSSALSRAARSMPSTLPRGGLRWKSFPCSNGGVSCSAIFATEDLSCSIMREIRAAIGLSGRRLRATSRAPALSNANRTRCSLPMARNRPSLSSLGYWLRRGRRLPSKIPDI